MALMQHWSPKAHHRRLYLPSAFSHDVSCKDVFDLRVVQPGRCISLEEKATSPMGPQDRPLASTLSGAGGGGSSAWNTGSAVAGEDEQRVSVEDDGAAGVGAAAAAAVSVALARSWTSAAHQACLSCRAVPCPSLC